MLSIKQHQHQNQNQRSFRAPLQTANSFTGTYQQTIGARQQAHSLRRAVSASIDSKMPASMLFERPASLQQPELMLDKSNPSSTVVSFGQQRHMSFSGGLN